MTATVKMIEGAATRVTCNHELLGADAERVARADAVETITSLGGMLSAVGAAAVGVAFLVTTGCVLGVAMLEIGLLCVLAAHAAYNLVSTAAPLLSRARPRRARRGGKRGVALDELPRRSA